MKILLFRHLLVTLFLLASSSGVQAQPSQNLYKIGAILPLTGPMAFAGIEVQNALNLALSEIQQSNVRYTVIVEDNGAGPLSTATATHKLIDIDKIQALITLWPEAANVAAPITDKAQILHYTIAWDPQIACSHQLLLSHQASVTDYARATLKLLQSQHIQSVTFFHDSVFQDGAEILEKSAADFGITFSKIHKFDRGKTDFRTELATSRKDGTQAFLIWSIMPETEIFLKQVRDLHIDKFMTGFFDVVQNLDLIEGLPFASEVYATSAFQEKFSSRYGQPSVMKGPNAFDIIHLLTKSVEAVSDFPPPARSVKKELLKVSKYSGAVGEISIDQCGNSAYPIVTKVVKQGRILLFD